MKSFFHKTGGFFRAIPNRIPQKWKDGYHRMATWFGEHPAVMVVVLALIVAIVNELLSRRSLLDTLVFIATRPLPFLANASIILPFMAFSLLFKRRNYLMWFFSLLWGAMGITDFVVRSFRITPFSAMDFTLVTSVFPILPRYLSWPGLILVGVFLLGLFATLLVCFIRAKRIPVRKKYAWITFAASLAACAALVGINHLGGLFPKHFSNLASAYNKYGFTYCFTVSIVDRGIDKPDDYDGDKIDEIVSNLEETTQTDETTPNVPPEDELGNTPNVIFVQLESFIDLKLLPEFSFSEDPTPIFTQLKKEAQSGLLTVPSIGAGTVNTEFEVLAGMNIEWFGAGEYPYETILKKTTCESLCYNLKEHGYATHAVHNYKGNFYDRNVVYGNIGFDTFTSLEYMNGVEYNKADWAKDAVLLRYVKECLTSTEGSDLVYCVTVQGHGKYPTKTSEDDPVPHVTVTSLPENADIDAFTYYVNQLRETDAFLGALISMVKAMEEETYIVFFGDHLPNIGMEEEWLPEGLTLYNTEYVIWHSGGKTETDRDLEAYQLTAELMSRLGYNDGILTKLHQTWSDKDDYLVYLEMLQYDILYGKQFCYGGENPYAPTDLKMGILDIAIHNVTTVGENTYILGQNFTPFSRVFVNGFNRSVTFVDERTLLLDGFAADEGDDIRVAQVADGLFTLSSTPTYTVP